jgi:glycerol uptake facilitator-like aquaporin
MPISGGCLNPAIGVSINIVNVIAKGEASAIQFIYVYACVPFLGAIVAILFFEKIYKRINFEQSESILEQFY